MRATLSQGFLRILDSKSLGLHEIIKHVSLNTEYPHIYLRKAIIDSHK